MPTRSLTTAAVARIKPPKTGQVDHFDRGYPGLALRVSYGGARSWIFFHRLLGKLRRLSLGRFPAMSLVEAREAWRAARLAVSKGESPAHLRPTTADSFAAVAEEWLKRDQGQNRSAAEVRRVIEHDVIPVWGERLVAAISRRDALELIDGVADRGALTMARRLHAHLHRLFRWAVGRGIIDANPMADLPKPGAAVKRDRVLTDRELAAVWKAAEKLGWPFGPAIRLLTITAARRDEIGSLRWSEIHDGAIRLPAERSKSGEARVIPLAPAAAELINALPRTGDHVFTTNGTTSISGWGRAKRTLDAAAAEIYGRPLTLWRVHDLRRTAATGLQRLGVGLQVIEAILGHVGGSRAGIVGVYQRHAFEAEKRTALEAWAREIDRIVSGGDHAIAPAAATLTLTSEAPTINPIDPAWLEAISRADAANSPEPLITHLNQPRSQLGLAETILLKLLLERVTFKRKKSGRFVPLGQKSRTEINELGAAFVRRRKQDGLSHEAAINEAIQTFPKDWFADDEGMSLWNYMKRGAAK